MTITVERNVPLPMRDGTILMAELFLPPGGPSPVLLQRTPYDKALLPLATLVADPLRLAEAGYAVVIQDVRGRYASGGEFRPFEHEGEDGYDTVEWCAAQPWSDGNVGMYGASYPGLLQIQTAALRPPHLRAIAPTATGADVYDHWLYPGAHAGASVRVHDRPRGDGEPFPPWPPDQARDRECELPAVQPESEHRRLPCQ